MRDKSHKEFIERWASFVKNNPGKWQEYHTAFINSQLNSALEFYKRLGKTKGGKEKIKNIFGIKNRR
jgi:hypothetical protein